MTKVFIPIKQSVFVDKSLLTLRNLEECFPLSTIPRLAAFGYEFLLYLLFHSSNPTLSVKIIKIKIQNGINFTFNM